MYALKTIAIAALGAATIGGLALSDQTNQTPTAQQQLADAEAVAPTQWAPNDETTEVSQPTEPAVPETPPEPPVEPAPQPPPTVDETLDAHIPVIGACLDGVTLNYDEARRLALKHGLSLVVVVDQPHEVAVKEAQAAGPLAIVTAGAAAEMRHKTAGLYRYSLHDGRLKQVEFVPVVSEASQPIKSTVAAAKCDNPLCACVNCRCSPCQCGFQISAPQFQSPRPFENPGGFIFSGGGCANGKCGR